MRADSVKGATYVNGSFMAGNSNYRSRDNLFAFFGSIHRSNNFGPFQAYYGLGITLGSYSVGQYDVYTNSTPYPPYNRDTINIPQGNHFFGAYGFNGGMSYVISFGKHFEWRVIGFETSIQKEFGNYLGFRRALKDSVINILATDDMTKTLGGFTELVWKRRSGTEFGYKMAFGGSFVSPDSYRGDSSISAPTYFSNTLHITKRRVTGFLQFNIGNHTGTFHTGVNVRLGRIGKMD
jgi:hypothetical protein